MSIALDFNHAMSVKEANEVLSLRWRNVNNRKSLHILPGLTLAFSTRSTTRLLQVQFAVTSRDGELFRFNCKRECWVGVYRMALQQWKETASAEELEASHVVGTDLAFEDVINFCLVNLPRLVNNINMKEIEAWLMSQNLMLHPDLRDELC